MAGTDVSGINGIQENGTAVSGFPELPALDSPESQYSGTGNNGINARIWWYYPAGTAGTAPPEQRYSKLRNGGLIWAGILNVDISELLKFHQSHGKIATLTAVLQEQQKGVLNIGGDNAVKSFREKNVLDAAPINAGYMVLEPQIFDYLEGDQTVFEREPLEKLAAENQLMSYIHKGYWQCMDNLREKQTLEKLISAKSAPWMKWDKEEMGDM